MVDFIDATGNTMSSFTENERESWNKLIKNIYETVWNEVIVTTLWILNGKNR